MADGVYYLELLREALYLVLLVSAPPLLASLAVGLLVSVLQAATQLHDQTLSLVPRLVVVLLSLVLAGPWIGAQLTRFTVLLLQGLPRVG
jgi:flagellar biosynthetic protein FliQ